jgi:hypothetical protein
VGIVGVHCDDDIVRLADPDCIAQSSAQGGGQSSVLGMAEHFVSPSSRRCLRRSVCAPIVYDDDSTGQPVTLHNPPDFRQQEAQGFFLVVSR